MNYHPLAQRFRKPKTALKTLVGMGEVILLPAYHR